MVNQDNDYGFDPSPGLAAEYVSGVLGGDVVVCDLVKRCVRRHVDDMGTGHSRGLVFDEIAAARATDFFPLLNISWPNGLASRSFLRPAGLDESVHVLRSRAIARWPRPSIL